MSAVTQTAFNQPGARAKPQASPLAGRRTATSQLTGRIVVWFIRKSSRLYPIFRISSVDVPFWSRGPNGCCRRAGAGLYWRLQSGRRRHRTFAPGCRRRTDPRGRHGRGYRCTHRATRSGLGIRSASALGGD
jgi:hypothetical protein